MIRIRIGMADTSSGANVILVKDGKILLLLRSKKSSWKPDMYGPPGGHVDSGETPVQAAVRETYEESGLVVKAADLKPLLQRTKHNFGMIYYFITDKFTGDGVGITLSNEHHGFAWVGMDRIDNYDTIFEAHELAVIKKALLSY